MELEPLTELRQEQRRDCSVGPNRLPMGGQKQEGDGDPGGSLGLAKPCGLQVEASRPTDRHLQGPECS